MEVEGAGSKLSGISQSGGGGMTSSLRALVLDWQVVAKAPIKTGATPSGWQSENQEVAYTPVLLAPPTSKMLSEGEIHTHPPVTSKRTSLRSTTLQ